jgi:hypothetical protein
MSFRHGVCAVLALVLILGCKERSGLQLAKVSGAVTLDGQPLAEGVIVFTKFGEIPKELPIVQGRYEGQVYVGPNHLQFAVYRAKKQKGASGPGAEQGSLENILPSRYNQESMESREVTEKGPNAFDFALTSK